MDFDRVLVEIGEFGRYQITNYLLICLPVMFGAANSLSYVFTAGVPSYRCFIPGCDDEHNPVFDALWMQNAVPGSTNIDGTFIPEICLRYPSRNSSSSQDICEKDNFFKNQPVRCNKWVFDNTERTIVQEWIITCNENAWMLALVGTIHFAGLVIGTAAAGFLADKFGRKLIFVICTIFMSITGVLQGIAWDYYSFLTFALLNAIGTSGVYPLAFIIGVEMVGPGKREMCSILLNYFYAVGEALVGLLAWLCQDWKLLQFVLSAPPILFAAYYWLLPESVRWLIVKQEYDKARQVIVKAARVNRKELSTDVLATFQKPEDILSGTDDNEKETVFVINNSNDDFKKYEIQRTLVLVLKSRILLLRILVLLFLWAVNAFVYYGLSLNSTSLSGNKYLNFALVCLVEIPGYSLAWVLMNKVGRRWSLGMSLLLCAVTCAAGGFVTKGMTWMIVSLFLSGKLGVTSSFAVLYTHTAEMMPTVIRSGGVGCMSTVARFGAMVAPFVPLLDVYYKPLPLIIFGFVSFIGGLLAFTLPETFGKKLPDTVEEAEQVGCLDKDMRNGF